MLTPARHLGSLCFPSFGSDARATPHTAPAHFHACLFSQDVFACGSGGAATTMSHPEPNVSPLAHPPNVRPDASREPTHAALRAICDTESVRPSCRSGERALDGQEDPFHHRARRRREVGRVDDPGRVDEIAGPGEHNPQLTTPHSPALPDAPGCSPIIPWLRVARKPGSARASWPRAARCSGISFAPLMRRAASHRWQDRIRAVRGVKG